MKIVPGSQQPAVAAETESKPEKVVPCPKQKEAAKRSGPSDKVDFSDPVNAGLQARQARQAQRIEALKARIEAGTYRVSSREVAEKMLAEVFDL